MVGVGHVLLGDVGHEVVLHLARRVGALGHETQAVAHAIDVGIDRQRGTAKPHGLHHIGRLAAHAWQLHQLGGLRGHLATIQIGQHPRHLDQMAGLGVGIAHRPHQFIDRLDRSLGHGAGVGEAGEEGGRDGIDAAVRTLGAEQRGTEQLEGGAKLQFRGLRTCLAAKKIEHLVVSFFTFHGCKVTTNRPNGKKTAPR